MIIQQKFLSHHIIKLTTLHSSQSLIVTAHDMSSTLLNRCIETPIMIVTPFHSHFINHQANVITVTLEMHIEIKWDVARMADLAERLDMGV